MIPHPSLSLNQGAEPWFMIRERMNAGKAANAITNL